MKTSIFLIFLLPFLLFSEVQTIKIGAAFGWYPLYYAEVNISKGILFDFVPELEKRLALKVKIIENLPWKRLLKNIKSGKLDLLFGAYYCADRVKYSYHSTPFMQNKTMIFKLKSKRFTYNNYDELKYLRGLKPRGGFYGKKFERYAAKHLDLQEVNDKTNALAMLLKNRADYFISDLWDVTYYLKRNKLSRKFNYLEKPISINDVSILISKKSTCFKSSGKINKVLAELKQEGFFKRILKNYE